MANPEKKTKENELFDIWKICFGDDNRVISAFFDCVYDRSLCVSEERDGKTVAALYLLPCEYHRRLCYYLYAAATLPEYRNQGVMSRLAERAARLARMHNATFIFLYPANDGLYSYYKKQGFSQQLLSVKLELTNEKLPSAGEVHLCKINEFFDVFRQNAKRFHAPVPERRIQPYISEISDNAMFSYCEKNGEVCALACCETVAGKGVSLFADAADGCLDELLSSFKVFGANSYNITLPACLCPDLAAEKNGMVMTLAEKTAGIDDLYVGFNMF